MFSTEFRYKLNNLRRILKKATVQLIRILFILASVATIVLMAYEYGYAISEAGKRYVTEGFNIIIRIFFFGSIATIFLDPKDVCLQFPGHHPDRCFPAYVTESASWIAEFYRCPVHFYECRVYYGPDGCRYGHHFYYNRSGGSPFADPNRRDRGHDFHQFYRFVFFHPNLF